MPEPIATWNPARGVWETQAVNMLCGHSELYSETWPTSGMTRGGVAYALPTPALPMDEPECSSQPSLLPTPCSQEPGGTAEAHLHRKNRLDGANRVTPTHLAFITALLPTPLHSDGGGPRGSSAGWGLRNTSRELVMLPTPTASEATGPGYTDRENGGGRNLRTEVTLLPTPQATDGEKVVRTSLGARTSLLFGAGSTSLDDPPLGPPSPDGRASD